MKRKILRKIKQVYLYLIVLPFDLIIGIIWKILPLRIHIKYLENYFQLKHPKSNIICIFAHYDKHNIVHDYVFHYLKELKNKLNATIVFISNSKKLYKEDLNKLKNYCEIIAIRRGRGRDFASYYIGYKLIEKNLNEYDYLILCNDSVYGPFKVRLKNKNGSLRFIS